MVVLDSEEESQEVARLIAPLLEKKWSFWGKSSSGECINPKKETRYGEHKSPCCLRIDGDMKWHKSPCDSNDDGRYDEGDMWGFGKKWERNYTFNPFCKKKGNAEQLVNYEKKDTSLG